MAKGGKREGAGRKPKAKSPPKRPTVNPESMDLTEAVESDKSIISKMDSFLSAKGKKQYKELVVKYDTPLDCLKAIRDDMVVRYMVGRKAEIDGLETARKIAQGELDELEQHGTIYGKKIPLKDRDKKALSLKGQIIAEAKISSSVTALGSELRQTNELIDRIESQRDDLTVNIFNILQGGKNKGKLGKLTDAMFTIPDDVEFEDEDIIDAEITPTEEESDE